MTNGAAHLAGVGALIVGFTGGVALVGAPTVQDPAVMIGARVTGFVSASSARYQNRPVMYYALECPATWIVQIDATSSWDNVLYLFDPAGRNVQYNDDTNWRNARIIYTCPATGRYRIAVGAASPSGQGEFTLEVTRAGGGTGTAAAPPGGTPGPAGQDNQRFVRQGELATAGSPSTVATDVYRAVFGEQHKDICWKGSYGRTAGEIGRGCPSGFERTGADLLCYPVCRQGFTGVGPVCWQQCPAGSTNLGLSCGQVGGSCPAGTTDVLGVCFKASYGRGVGVGATCLPGQEQDFQGGLCYPACRPGMNGQGPVCWGRCGGDYPVDCGAACATDAAACGFAVFEQVAASADVALNVAALVGTAGTANGALRAAQLGRRQAMQMGRRQLSSQARSAMKGQIRERIDSIVARQVRYTNASDTAVYLGDQENRERTAELLVAAQEAGEFDFLSLLPQSVADVEPTGVLALVNSFNKPLCQPGRTYRTIASLPPRLRTEGEPCSESLRCDVALRCAPGLSVCQPEVPVIGQIRIGQTVRNTLGPRLIHGGRPAEFYRFQCQPGLAVRIALNSAFDNVAIVTDPAFVQLAFNDDFAGNNARLDYTCRVASEVLIGAGGLNGTQHGAYSMTLSVPGDGAQPIDRGPVARVVNAGETVSGSIDENSADYEGHRLQYFNFQCRTGQSLRLEVNSVFDNEVYVFDMQGRRLAYEDAGDANNARLNFSCPFSGPVRIAAGGWRQSPRGPFTLTVRELSAPARQPSGGGIQISGTIRLDQSVQGTLAPGSTPFRGRPMVFYQFVCRAGRMIQVDASSRFDNFVLIANTAGEVLARNEDGNGADARLVWTCPADDAFLAGVGTHQPLGGSEPFSLAFSSPGGGGSENDRGRAVAIITAGESIRGVIDSTASWFDQWQVPVRFYAFTCQRGIRIRATVRAAYSSYVFVVRTGAGTVAWSSGDLGNPAETEFSCPDNEIYRIGAGAYRRAQAGPFTLSVSRIP